MDFVKNNEDNTNQDRNGEEDKDPVELPPDTLAILQEFLQNKDKQSSSECEEMFEENWVYTTFYTLYLYTYIYIHCPISFFSN